MPFLLLLFLLSSQLVAQQKQPARYPYQLYLPKNYATTKQIFPLVIYLHGGSQKGTDLTKLNLYGLPKLVNQGRNFPFIIAAPQCPDGKF